MPRVDISKLDIENLDDLDSKELTEGFQKIQRGRKFDDGTGTGKAAKKRPGKRIIEKDDFENDED